MIAIDLMVGEIYGYLWIIQCGEWGVGVRISQEGWVGGGWVRGREVGGWVGGWVGGG